MDKYEYKVRANEIRDLISSSQYEKAAEIADTIDWTRVKKSTFLCTISDLYKINKRYNDAIELLQLAYDRYPGGKDILYSLCDLYLITGDTIQAISTYKEFCQVAGNDIRRYILQYKIYVAQEVSLEERIEVLEEIKKRDYRDKWAYYLAYNYHRVGLATKCVEECDELITWFGEGKYVDMAMELKMLHQPLTEAQQAMYDRRIESVVAGARRDDGKGGGDTVVLPDISKKAGTPQPEMSAEAAALSLGHTQVYHAGTQEPEINVKPVDVGEYNTINLQKELAQGVQQVLENGVTGEIKVGSYEQHIIGASTKKIPGQMDEKTILQSDTKEIPGSDDDMPPHIDFDPHAWDKAVEEEFSENENEGENEAEGVSDYTQYLGAVADKLRNRETDTKESKEAGQEDIKEEKTEGPTAEIAENISEGTASDEIKEEKQDTEHISEDRTIDTKDVGEDDSEKASIAKSLLAPMYASDTVEIDSVKVDEAISAQPPEPLAEVMTQEGDGQLGIVVPETPQPIKQITGQMSINDVMAEWSRMKREHEEINRRNYREQFRQQTGELFNEFEEAALNGVLETLEREAEEAAARRLTEERALEDAEIVMEGESAEPAQESCYEDEQETDYPDEITDESVTAETEEVAEIEETSEETINGEEIGEQEEYVDQYQEVFEDNAEGFEFASEEEPEEKPEEVPIEESSVTEAIEQVEAGSEEPVSDTEDEPEEEENRSQRYYEKKVEEAKKAHSGEILEEDDDAEPARELTPEEKELFGPFIQSKSARRQLIAVLDGVSMASYTGNIVLTGGDGTDTSDLATALLKDIKQSDSNFSGKVARISGEKLNSKKVSNIIKQLANGALIIEKAHHMSDTTAEDLYKNLDQENLGIIVTLIDTERNMEKLFARSPKLSPIFNERMNVKPLTAEQLANFAVKYAYEKEFSIDEMGMLGLHTQITLRQTSTHSVNVLEVREIVDNAIKNVKKKNLKHFFDILLGKRYDEEDMIILGEVDFR